MESPHMTKIDIARGESNCLHLNAWSSSELRTMILPRLKCLSAFINSADEETLKRFWIVTWRRWKKLKLECGRDSEKVFFHTIAQHCGNLKKLHLKVRELRILRARRAKQNRNFMISSVTGRYHGTVTVGSL